MLRNLLLHPGIRSACCARSRSLTFAATWRRTICRGTSSRNLRVGSASRQPTTCPVFSRGTSAAGSKGTSTTSGISIGWKAWRHSWTSWPGSVDTRKAPTYCSGAVMLVFSPKTSVSFSLQLGNVCCGDWTSRSGGTLRLSPSAPELCCSHPQLEQPVLYHAASVRFAKGGPSH